MFTIPTVTVAKTTLTGTASSVTLTYVAPSVAWTPRHLVVRANGKNESGLHDVFVQFNGDTGSNYNRQYMYGSGTSEVAARQDSQTGLSSFLFGGDANEMSSGELLLPDALSTRSHKSAVSFFGQVENYVVSIAGRWASTAAITSVTIYTGATFSVGSTFELCVVDESFNIDEQIKGSNGTFTVSSIGAANGDLVQIGNLRTDRALNRDLFEVALNSDTTGSNYTHQEVNANGTSINASGTSARYIGWNPGNNGDTGAFGAYVGQFSNYSDGSNDRTILSFSGGISEVGDSGGSSVRLFSSRWNNTAAITSIGLNPETGTNFITGSMLSTYAVPKNLIGRQELSGTATTVTFADIPQTYDHLELIMYARTDGGVTRRDIICSVNADTTNSNYVLQALDADSSTVSAFQNTGSSATARYIARLTGNNATANAFGSSTTTFYNYTKTDRHKHYLSTSGNGPDNPYVRVSSSRFESTAAITSLVITAESGDDFMVGSVFELRGIHADIAPVAGSASDVDKLNGIASGDIEAIN